jgi:triacylglycerol esterase/lipase EstA (alpha/beta hydrolase family)
MRHRIVLPFIGLCLALVGALSVAVTPTSYADGLPPLPTSPLGDPPGANDWDCEPTAARPTPVILVHGTIGDRRNLLERLSRSIKDAGSCVFSLDYGNRGLGEISASARELKRYTQRVLRATGAEKVSMVGHSQGGMMPRYFIKFLGGAKLVDDLVGIAPSNHGTVLTGGGNPLSDLVNQLVGVPCRACVQQGAGSAFLTRLNRGDETPGRVSYTQITSRYDQIVIPHTSGYLVEGPRTTNLTVQDLCPLAVPEHLTMPLATPTIDIVLDALARRGPARADVTPRCL